MSLASGTLPIKWKQANITPIFKKGDRTIASNYRPISLTSVACKILERIVVENFILQLYCLEDNDLLSKQQHGFLKGKSCTTN